MEQDRGGDGDDWMEERRRLFASRAAGRRHRARRRKLTLSEARAQARDCEARPEIMAAWASAEPGERIPDEAWDLITAFDAYLWVKSGCELDLLRGIGEAVRLVATRRIGSVESEDFAACLLRDPRIVDDRGR